jgi:uncharacterized protein (TIGR03083 family)
MDKLRYLGCLDADYRRLREVAAVALTAPVPSCPEWTGADLVRHVAMVYHHKIETLRTQAAPKSWPPDLGDEQPIALLDRTCAELVAELTARDATEPTHTWYQPNQTVGFWARRMAQETVIHRVDGELAAGVEPAPIPTDLAVDGADEVLVCFLSYFSHQEPEEFGDLLAGCDGQAVLVDAGARSWTVRLAPTGVDVIAGPTDTDATVSGSPDAVLLWLWRRVGDEAVRIDGDLALAAQLRQLLDPATQ